MFERKLFKTKLCILYQRGRCSRQSCSFAHGDAELRRFSSSMNGRREFRGPDLRGKLDRRRSPYRRDSPVREAHGRRPFQPRRQSRDKGYSPSRSPQRSERKYGKRKPLDGQSDASRSPKTLDSDEDQAEGGKISSRIEKDALEEKLKEVKLDFEILNENKCQLEDELKEKTQVADNLSVKIEDLEVKLNKEQEDSRRMTSKNKKFLKALGRYLRAQEELKRSQIRLQRLADQLSSGSLKPGFHEADSVVDTLSDGEPNNGNKHEMHSHASPPKKRSRLSIGTSEDVKPAGSWDDSTQERHTLERSKHFEVSNTGLMKNDAHKLLIDEHKHKEMKSNSGTASEKVKGSEFMMPATGMAAHAIDELIDVVEIDETSPVIGSVVTSGSKAVLAALLPPPKTASNAYDQYEGDDDYVDVEDVDADARDVDMNGEVDIE